MTFSNHQPVRLAGPLELSLDVRHLFITKEDDKGWTVQSSSYLYHVYGANSEEIMAFHWHPGRGPIHQPHAHFKTLDKPFPMGKLHIPTGRVSLEAVVRLLITEMEVKPARKNWKHILKDTEADFIGRRTWHTHAPIPGAPTESLTSS